MEGYQVKPMTQSERIAEIGERATCKHCGLRIYFDGDGPLRKIWRHRANIAFTESC
jgi:hypothetical protein